jgi:hypothetical protein
LVTWPTNESVMVGHGYGDSESMPPYSGDFPREFHHGVDIPGTARGAKRTQLLAVVDGTFRRDGRFEQTYRLTPDDGTGIDDVCIYSHVVRPRSIPTGHVDEGDHILNLAHITNWVEPAHVCDHLHFQIGVNRSGQGAVMNPLEVLPHDDDDHDLTVTIEQFRYVRRSGDTGRVRYLSETSPVIADAPILRSDIVIIASAEDDMDYADWTPGAHSIEYEVKDGPTPDAKIDPMELFEWEGSLPVDRHYRVVYNMGPRPCHTTFHFNYYVVTNTDGNDPISNDDFDQYWKTNASEAGDAGNGVGSDDASLNSQAFFPDGTYVVEVTGWDIKDNWDNDEKTVVLDNFKPYVTRVIVKEGETGKYDASWPETGEGTLEALNRETDETCNARTLTFEVYFSETMDHEWDDFRVEIQPDGSPDWINVSDSISWSRENFDNDKWTGRVTLPSDAGEGEARIRIRARDLAGNELDTDPQNIAEFNRASTSWSNYSSGSDENHRIMLGAARGSFTAVLHRGHPPP